MSKGLQGLLKNVSDLGLVRPEHEIDLLRELPTQTLFLSLKEADLETRLWVFEHATVSQVQGLADIDLWRGEEFIPSKAASLFFDIARLTPRKIFEYAKGLDSEIWIRSLLEWVTVEPYDPQNPPDVEGKSYLLTPDNSYVLLFKVGVDINIQESLRLFLNKISAVSLEDMRKILESCRWEIPSDLEDFGARIKKGRLEEMGFVDRTEAISLYAYGEAPDVKNRMLANPLPKNSKIGLKKSPSQLGGFSQTESTFSMEEDPHPLAPGLLPKVMRVPRGNKKSFFFSILESIESQELRENLGLELIRVMNAAASADDLLQGSLEDFSKSVERSFFFLDLGLQYLSGGKPIEARAALENQPLFQIYRLGWLTLADLVRVSTALKQSFPPSFWTPQDHQLLVGLKGRHPQLSSQTKSALGFDPIKDLDLLGLVCLGEKLTTLSEVGAFLKSTIEPNLGPKEFPYSPGETIYMRLFSQLWKWLGDPMGSSVAFTKWTGPMDETVWAKGVEKFRKSPESFDKLIKGFLDKIPKETTKAYLGEILEDILAEVKTYIQTSKAPEKIPDPRFFNALFFKNS